MRFVNRHKIFLNGYILNGNISPISLLVIKYRIYILYYNIYLYLNSL